MGKTMATRVLNKICEKIDAKLPGQCWTHEIHLVATIATKDHVPAMITFFAILTKQHSIIPVFRLLQSWDPVLFVNGIFRLFLKKFEYSHSYHDDSD